MAFFTLLPNARTLLSSVANPPVAGGLRRQLSFGVEIRAEGAAVPGELRIPVGAELLSAGDVIGIDPRMVSRVDPPQNATGFEPNYLPFVEFADADFPWRYSYDTGNGIRVKPWIVLIALKPGEFEFLDQGSAPCPRIRVMTPTATLPDLAQSWAFAHVHVARGEQLGNDLAELIASRPERHHARLLCLRRLDPNTAYTLVLVPATEAGRLSGLGTPGPVTPFDKPAWGVGTTEGLELPVYFQSRFVTSVLEDFELLARRLKPFQIEQGSVVAAPQLAFAGNPGFFEGYRNPNAEFEIQDALMRADRTVEAFNTDPELIKLLKPTLEKVIAGETVAPGDDGPDHDDPLVAMPPYGWRFMKQKTVTSAAATQGAFVDRINLDLKFRHVAGLGAETVRRNQEHFARICWNQYRELAAANATLMRLKSAQVLSTIIGQRHVTRLPSTIIASLAENVQDIVKLPDGLTFSETLTSSGVPRSFASRVLRRVASKRTLRQGSAAQERPARMVVPVPVIPGVGGVEPLRRPLVDRRRLTVFTAEARRRITQLFGNDALLSGSVPRTTGIAVRPFAIEAVKEALSQLFVSLPSQKAKFLIAGLAAVESERLDPIMREPIISDPLVEALRAFESRAILRGIDTVPNNTVSVIKENRLFVEAFLVGANHEMNNELRWREFPTDMRGTVFRRFWDRKRPPGDPAGDDIPQIHRWTAPLGGNFSAHDVDRREALVLLIKGDLIRKYGMILAVLNHAPTTQFVRGEGVDHQPIFAGQLGGDACYFGFDVARDAVLTDKSRHFFVLFEAPGRVRFGLDAATAAVRRDRFAFRTATLKFPIRTLGRDPNTARLPAHLITGHTPPAQATRWDDLSWSHMQIDAASYINVVTTNPGITDAPNYWNSNRDSASIARSFWQKPIAAVVPATRILG